MKSKTIFIKKTHLMIAGIFLAGIAVLAGSAVMNRMQNDVQILETVQDPIISAAAGAGDTAEKDYIKWVDFKVTREALQQAYEYDVETHGSECELDWIELLAYLGAKYGGDFKRYKPEDMGKLAEMLKRGEMTMEMLTADMKYYPYFHEAYSAVLGGLVGEYEIAQAETQELDDKAEADDRVQVENSAKSDNIKWEKKYGLKSFHPIAKGFPYSEYDDFGVSRSYGYRRNHLGHDMMGQVGTPVVAVESGYVAVLGWNQYGGWRVGINSFDGKRYYYYAHLRQNFPYAKWLKEGSIVQAGDVIGYMGRTGYSTTENVNNIDQYHLHFGMQLIFDECQREGTNQIWVDVYPLVQFLHQNQSETVRDDVTKEWARSVQMKDFAAEEYKMRIEENKNQHRK